MCARLVTSGAKPSSSPGSGLAADGVDVTDGFASGSLLICARAARAIITVKTAMNGAIPRRALVLRVSLRVMGDLLCHGIRGPGSAMYLSLSGCRTARNRATAFGRGRNYDPAGDDCQWKSYFVNPPQNCAIANVQGPVSVLGFGVLLHILPSYPFGASVSCANLMSHNVICAWRPICRIQCVPFATNP